MCLPENISIPIINYCQPIPIRVVFLSQMVWTWMKKSNLLVLTLEIEGIFSFTNWQKVLERSFILFSFKGELILSTSFTQRSGNGNI